METPNLRPDSSQIIRAACTSRGQTCARLSTVHKPFTVTTLPHTHPPWLDSSIISNITRRPRNDSFSDTSVTGRGGVRVSKWPGSYTFSLFFHLVSKPELS